MLRELVHTTGRIRLARALRALLLLFLVGSTDLLAQGVTTAGVAGRITDPLGAPITNARVELRRDDTGAVFTAATNEAGRFSFMNLRPGGPYTLVASRIGLQTVSREGLHLSIGQRLTVDIRLSETAVPLPDIAVQVAADPEFDRTRMGPVTVVDRQTLDQLPTISRDFTEFAQLSPLVVVDDGGVSVAGSNLRFNNIQIDGALNQDVFGLSPSGVAGGRARGRVIPLSAIEELQILVAPYDVRQSGFTGGVLNAVTRSGTNEFQTSVFGFYRSDALVGDALIGGAQRSPGQLDNILAGFDVGGPIVRDRLHFFAAGEFERRRRPPDGFIVGIDDPILTKLIPDSVSRASSILEGYGADAGEAGEYTLDNNLANAFARLDFQLDGSNSLMLRYNYAGADDDPAPNRLPGNAYEMSSIGTTINSRNHSIVGQWLSTFGGSLSNDLLVSTQFLRDQETPLATYPRVEVMMSGFDGETGVVRELRAGSSFFGSGSDLEQDILQISNALTLSLGDHSLTFGGGFERFGIRRSYLPGSLGTFRFASLADLEANEPTEYVVNVPLAETAGTTDFSVNQFSAYVQEEARLSNAFTLQLGARIDVPTMPDAPAANAAVEQSFGFRTDELPSGKILFSPRLGFNLRLGGELETQIRGGTGIFTGRPPFAWLAEAYQNDGLTTGFLTCKRRNVGVPDPEVVPLFDGTTPAPNSCADGRGSESAVPTVTVFDPDFKFPQDFKASIAVDQRLPAGFVLSLEGIYTKAVNQIFLEDRNIGPAVTASDRTPENGYSDGFGFGDRESFGDGGAGSELIDPEPGTPPEPREPIFFPRRVDEDFGQVIRVGNRSANFSYAVSGMLRKRFGPRLAFDVGYAYNRSADLQSLASLDATANFGFTAIERDPNNPTRQTSLYDRPHKLITTATAALPDNWGGTRFSVLYIGQSGQPYSYVYADDLNADGYSGIGQALDLANDLIYVNENASSFPSRRSPISGILFEQLVSQEACLQRNRLRVLNRNSCRTPWSHQVDLRIAQGIRLGGANLDLMLDVLNVLNLLNSGWGQVQAVNQVVQVISVPGRIVDSPFGIIPSVDDPLEARYVGALQRGETGGIRAVRPYVPQMGPSQWQAQFGVRLRFR
ncbi:MAG: carboxypeptidase regulatory-like domain-containing protein [Gemmatimonadota bacterium]